MYQIFVLKKQNSIFGELFHLIFMDLHPYAHLSFNKHLQKSSLYKDYNVGVTMPKFYKIEIIIYILARFCYFDPHYSMWMMNKDREVSSIQKYSSVTE